MTFDANGGSVTPTSATTKSWKLEKLPTPTYDGYDFLGWYTEKDGGNAVTTDTIFTKDSPSMPVGRTRLIRSTP